MIDPFIPDSVRVYIEGQELILVNFDFIPTVDFPVLDVTVDWFDIPQNNELLDSLGIGSQSTFVNILSFIFIIFGLIVLHLFLRFILTCGTKNQKHYGK